jgi:hypothetical protein
MFFRLYSLRINRKMKKIRVGFFSLILRMTKSKRVRWNGNAVRSDIRNIYEFQSISLKGNHLLKRRNFVREEYQTNRVWSWVDVSTSGTSNEVRCSIKYETFFDHLSVARPEYIPLSEESIYVYVDFLVL